MQHKIRLLWMQHEIQLLEMQHKIWQRQSLGTEEGLQTSSGDVQAGWGADDDDDDDGGHDDNDDEGVCYADGNLEENVT